MHRWTTLTAIAASFLASSALAQSPVLVVDDDGGAGVDHTSIQDAVTAAAPGTVILVKSGSYGPFVVDGKSLSIVADAGASVTVFPRCEVIDLPEGATVLLTGLRFFASAGGETLTIDNCTGTVWAHDCSFLAGQIILSVPPYCVGVFDSNRVVFSQSEMTGGFSQLGTPAPGPVALLVGDSAVHLYDCEVSGGVGLPENVGPAGIYMEGGFLFASGSTVIGGEGGLGGNPFFCSDGGDGGPALHLAASASSATLLDCTLTGGPGGATQPVGGGCQPGAPGPPTQVDFGSITNLSGSARSIAKQVPVDAGAMSATTFTGGAGELLWWLIATNADATFTPVLNGTLCVDPGFFAFFLGIVPGSGVKSVSLTANLPAQVDALVAFEQGVYLDFTTGVATLGAPSPGVIVQPGF